MLGCWQIHLLFFIVRALAEGPGDLALRLGSRSLAEAADLSPLHGLHLLGEAPEVHRPRHGHRILPEVLGDVRPLDCPGLRMLEEAPPD